MNNIEPKCIGCDFIKCVAVNRQIYYCDNERREDDMGKLEEDKLPETSPDWCPKRQKVK